MTDRQFVRRHLAICAAVLLSWAACPHLQAAEDAAPQPQPVTTADPEISPDHLKLMVKPLTRDELAVEAEGWRELLKAKVQEISDLQIGVKEKHEEVAEAKEEVAAAEEEVPADDGNAGEDQADEPPPGEDAQADAEAAAEEAAAEAEKVAQAKARLAEKIPQLQDERANLIDRLNIVLDAWEEKGGKPEEYRQYAVAVSGLELDVTDASTTWTAIWGWITSEQGGQRWLWNLLKFVAILAAFYALAIILSKIVKRASENISGASELLKKFLASFVKQLVMLIGVIVAVSALELNISPLLAAIGGAAFVIGLALQGTLSNFASGLIILGYRPFDVGDVVEAAGIAGIVDSMSLLSTKIRTFDNKVMIVPNNKIATDTITNATASDTRRVDLTFGIGYQDDIGKAQGILESIVKDHELVLDEPAPVVTLNELGDSSVNFLVRPWAKTSDYWTVYWDITRKVKEEFDAQGVSIPFPQRDIHVYQESAPNGSTAGTAEQQHA